MIEHDARAGFNQDDGNFGGMFEDWPLRILTTIGASASPLAILIRAGAHA